MPSKSIAEQVGVMDEGPGALSAPPEQPELAEPERPEWLPDQFSDGAALARAYDEARREMSRAQTEAQATSRALQDLAAQVEELRQQPQQGQQQYDPNADPLLMMEAQAWDEGDTMRALQVRDQRYAQMMMAANQMYQPPASAQNGNDPELYATVVMQEMKARYGDEWTPELMHEVGEAAQQFITPEMPFQQTIERLTFVTDAIRHRKLAQQQQQAATSEAHAAQTKRLAQTAPGQSGRPAGAKSPEDELMARWAQMPKPYWQSA